jgi:hypothetical protein
VTGRSRALRVVSAVTGLGLQTNVIVVELVAPGDFEPHVLEIRRGLLDDRPPKELDLRLARTEFGFKAECRLTSTAPDPAIAMTTHSRCRTSTISRAILTAFAP